MVRRRRSYRVGMMRGVVVVVVVVAERRRTAVDHWVVDHEERDDHRIRLPVAVVVDRRE